MPSLTRKNYKKLHQEEPADAKVKKTTKQMANLKLE